MNMKKIIHEELGQELENIGFHYVSGERIAWPYEREKDGQAGDYGDKWDRKKKVI